MILGKETAEDRTVNQDTLTKQLDNDSKKHKDVKKKKKTASASKKLVIYKRRIFTQAHMHMHTPICDHCRQQEQLIQYVNGT